MLKFLAIISSLILISCSNNTHIAELQTYNVTQFDKVQLLMESNIIKSTSLKHNMLPLHTEKLENRVISQTPNKQFKTDNVTLSDDSYLLGIFFLIKAEVNNKTHFDISLSYPKAFTSQRIYKVYSYYDQYLGILHSQGFTLFKKNKFCKTYFTNPNGRFHTAIIESPDNKKNIVVTSRGPITNIDKPIDEWKVIKVNKDC